MSISRNPAPCDEALALELDIQEAPDIPLDTCLPVTCHKPPIRCPPAPLPTCWQSEGAADIVPAATQNITAQDSPSYDIAPDWIHPEHASTTHHAAPTRAKQGSCMANTVYHTARLCNCTINVSNVCAAVFSTARHISSCSNNSSQHMPYILMPLTYQADLRTSPSYTIKLLQQACTVANFSHHHPDHSSSYADCQQGSYLALHVPNGCIVW